FSAEPLVQIPTDQTAGNDATDQLSGSPEPASRRRRPHGPHRRVALSFDLAEAFAERFRSPPQSLAILGRDCAFRIGLLAAVDRHDGCPDTPRGPERGHFQLCGGTIDTAPGGVKKA